MLEHQTTEPEMTIDEFTQIRDLVHEKSGMFFDENKLYLVRNRLVRRLASLGINSFKDYFYHVKYDNSQVEFNHLMDALTNNETSFFRNEPQLLSFSDEVLPEIKKRKIDNGEPRNLRIWSAGCSTGEEPYTLAILIAEKFGSTEGWNIEIMANDISEEALKRSRRGEYSGLTLRNVKPTLLARHFEKHGDAYRIKPDIKGLVKFAHLNLNDQIKMSINTNFDVIFCRNVMIYFSEEAKKKLVRSYYNALRPGGYLYVGHSETLHGISKAFKLVYLKNALVYSKEYVPDGKPSNRQSTTTINNSNIDSKPSGSARAFDLLSKVRTAGAV